MATFDITAASIVPDAMSAVMGLRIAAIAAPPAIPPIIPPPKADGAMPPNLLPILRDTDIWLFNLV